MFNKNLFFPLMTSLLFSCTGIIMKILYSRFSPATDVAFFFLILFACLNIFIFSILKNRGFAILTISKKQFLYSFVAAGLLLFLTNAAVFESLRYIDAGIQKIIAITELFFIVVINSMFFRNKINRKNIFAAGLILFGLFFVAGRINVINNSNFIKGFCFALSSTRMTVLYYYIVDLIAVEIDGLKYCFYTFLGSLRFIAILLYARGETEQLISSINQPKLLFAFFLSSLVVYTFSFPLYFESLKRVGVLTSSLCFAMSPAITIIGGYLILGERLTLSQMFGAVLIIFASLINIVEWKTIFSKFTKH